jgi:hypothetical protein
LLQFTSDFAGGFPRPFQPCFGISGSLVFHDILKLLNDLRSFF